MHALVCDMDEGLVPAVGHVEFDLDDERLALDLCAEHMVQLRDLLRPVARPVAGTLAPFPVRRASGPKAASGKGALSNRKQVGSRRALAAERERVRTWAKAQGLDVAERGRIPQPVVEAYVSASKR